MRAYIYININIKWRNQELWWISNEKSVEEKKRIELGNGKYWVWKGTNHAILDFIRGGRTRTQPWSLHSLVSLILSHPSFDWFFSQQEQAVWSSFIFLILMCCAAASDSIHRYIRYNPGCCLCSTFLLLYFYFFIILLYTLFVLHFYCPPLLYKYYSFFHLSYLFTNSYFTT